MMKMNEKAEGLYQRLYDKDKGRLFPEGLYWIACACSDPEATTMRHIETSKSLLRKIKKAVLPRKC
jgi:hypothetical protein